MDTNIPLINIFLRIEKIKVCQKNGYLDKKRIEIKLGIIKIIGKIIYKEYPKRPIDFLIKSMN